MNATRRKALSKIMDRVEDLQVAMRQLNETRDAIVSDLQQHHDDEEEQFDNLSEKQQEGEKGETIQENMIRLQDAINELEQLDLEFAPDDILSAIEDARGME